MTLQAKKQERRNFNNITSMYWTLYFVDSQINSNIIIPLKNLHNFYTRYNWQPNTSLKIFTGAPLKIWTRAPKTNAKSLECTIYKILPKRTIDTKISEPKERLDFARTDFAALNNYFKSIDLTTIVEKMELNKAFECFYDTMKCAIDKFVPKKNFVKRIQDHGIISNLKN